MSRTASFATAKGRRPYQEDFSANFTIDKSEVFAVFDGHGGGDCAAYCAENFERICHETFTTGDASADLREAFRVLSSVTQFRSSGSTASVVVLDGSSAVTGVLGDSPIMVHDSERWHFSPEHNVRTNDAEAAAAEARGGWILNGYLYPTNGYCGLQMSRALGDAALDSVLSREPEIQSYENVQRIVLATDGICDPGHSDTTSKSDVAQLADRGFSAASLVGRATEELRTGDNATAFVIEVTATH